MIPITSITIQYNTNITLKCAFYFSTFDKWLLSTFGKLSKHLPNVLSDHFADFQFILLSLLIVKKQRRSYGYASFLYYDYGYVR